MSSEPIAPEEEESQAEPDPKELVVKWPQFMHDLLLYFARISAALLCHVGAVSIDDCRMMSGLKPLSEGKRTRLRQQLKWMRDSGRTDLPVALYDLWHEAQNE